MPQPRSFGFEAEFVTNGQGLTAALHAAGLFGGDHIHSYHCGCDHCEFTEDGSVYRVQSDSSLGGDGAEVISNVFTNYTDSLRHMAELQRIAVEQDAEPGARAGFHVHVNRGGLTPDEYMRSCWQFVRFEHALLKLANGPLGFVRGFNYPAVNSVKDYWDNDDPLSLIVNEPLSASCSDTLNYCVHSMDRHANISVHSPHRTIEYRLWNSTRSAWRMEMHVRISQAMTAPQFTAALANVEVAYNPFDVWSGDSTRAGIDLDLRNFICALGGFDSRAAELAERQQAFTNRGEFAAAFAA